MKKSFTIEVPNTLYSDNFSENKTLKVDYDGPVEISIVIDKNTGDIIDLKFNDDESSLPEDQMILTIDANTNTKAAYLLSDNTITDYQFQQETLLDGSKYNNKVNPSLHDYYKVDRYNFEKSDFDYTLIVRPWKTKNLLIAEKLKTAIESALLARITIDDGGNKAVKDYLLSRGFEIKVSDDQLVSEINNFITTLNNFIAEESNIISWKYTELPETEMPEIPDYLKIFV